MAMHPELVGIEKEADGWVKKYVLTYRLPDGTPYQYHCATRHDEDAFRALLARNGEASKAMMAALEQTADDGGAHASESPAGTTPATDNAPAEGEPSPDAVCIVARTPRDTLVMIREFRYPLNSWCIAFPAGLVDPGEGVSTCAVRELEEETGFSILPGTDVQPLPQPGYSSTGLTDETVQVVFMQAERKGEAHTECNELIEVFELPIADIRDFLDTNQLPIGTRAQLILELFAHESRLSED